MCRWLTGADPTTDAKTPGSLEKLGVKNENLEKVFKILGSVSPLRKDVVHPCLSGSTS